MSDPLFTSIADLEKNKFASTGPAKIDIAVKVVNPDGTIVGGSSFTGLTPVTSPTIYNVSAVLANTQYSQSLSAGTKRFTIRVRGLANLQLAYISGNTNSIFIKIPSGTQYEENDLDLTGVTLYFESSVASQVIEIVQWT